jgi:hypothetical protein
MVRYNEHKTRPICGRWCQFSVSWDRSVNNSKKTSVTVIPFSPTPFIYLFFFKSKPIKLSRSGSNTLPRPEGPTSVMATAGFSRYIYLKFKQK